MIKIKLHGAAGGEVTGSAYQITTSEANILLDAGMFQGSPESEARNKLPQGVKPDKLDAILLTHGHLDHSGRVPLLIKYGYNGPLYATHETLELAQIILEDSARLQVSDAMRHNRKHWKRGQAPAEPLYNTEHVEYMRELYRPVHYNEAVNVAKGIQARWVEAGHMLGSGSIELTVTEGRKKRVIVFSGDLGPLSMPLLKPYETLKKADLVFLESTYGDRDHKSYTETIQEFEDIVNEVVAEKGKMLVPTFAIGRAQQIIYHLAEKFHDGSIPPFKVYLDSPMAIKALSVYSEHQNNLDEEFQALKRKGVFPLREDVFIPCLTAEASKQLNEEKGPCMILAGAGMCNGGRILHHLFHNVSKPQVHIIIVGYQSNRSLGRRLVERVPKVRIFGEEKPLKAQVHTLSGFSAHAGQTELLGWFEPLAGSKPKLCLVHGEDMQRNAFAALIKKKLRIQALLPRIGDIIEI